MVPLIRPLLASATTRCFAHAAPTSSSIPFAAARCLSTTPNLNRQKPSHLTVDPEQCPDYPYERSYTYKQANEGLYGGARVRFGNTISKKWDRKSRTKWFPNRHTKRLWSVGLQNFIRVRLTARTLRTVDKLGGIDEYLLGPKARRLKELGPAGWALRWKIMQTPIIQERFAREREALGLPPKPVNVVHPAAFDMPPKVLERAARQLNDGRTPEELMRDIKALLERGEEIVLDDGNDGEAEAQAHDEAGAEAEAEADADGLNVEPISAEDKAFLDKHASPEHKKILQELDQYEKMLKDETYDMAPEDKKGDFMKEVKLTPELEKEMREMKEQLEKLKNNKP